ncbi:hypothetical protein IMG5_009250 [Ichthyophthirius multifiliis]|uniref:Transmembrane protein n=1 Tax=Ichthyophthirius multifiliis TaxID=5932 RepID=G0QJU2_ICHMU|nr:hypothetical protein IMG5_009250 [Ichthyophthirius multifiliis]EGR34516.1 hypothetical protein IMG5_009250 [Ichthyophthirius multifiliis]|eukprot:XP_004039820.1 hypothetical protein IMG5_009250 [Ichthyophthirius multifiliis]
MVRVSFISLMNQFIKLKFFKICYSLLQMNKEIKNKNTQQKKQNQKNALKITFRMKVLDNIFYNFLKNKSFIVLKVIIIYIYKGIEVLIKLVILKYLSLNVIQIIVQNKCNKLLLIPFFHFITLLETQILIIQINLFNQLPKALLHVVL